MPGVFISYRHEDSSGYAGRLFDILSAHFGRKNTFMDLDTIEGGEDFSKVIEASISVCEVLVAVIGSHWLTVTEADGTRRLDNPRDFVRLEIGHALKRGIRVIPVLVGGVALPRAEELPEDLRQLSARQAVEVRDAHFHPDAERLIEAVQKALRGFRVRHENFSRKRLVSAILSTAGLLILVGALAMRYMNSHAPTQFLEGSKGSVTTSATGTAKAKNTKPPGSDDAAKAAAHLGDVAGRWISTVKYDWGDSYPEVLEFEVDGSELSGTASFLGVGRGILDGTITGDRISFMTKSLTSLGSDEQAHEDKHYYKGTVVSDAIRFTMLTDSSIESHVPIHFLARRATSN